jgi:hypothetical protein
MEFSSFMCCPVHRQYYCKKIVKVCIELFLWVIVDEMRMLLKKLPLEVLKNIAEK